MIVKVRVGATSNKGDALMLIAIAERLAPAHSVLVDRGRVNSAFLRLQSCVKRSLRDHPAGRSPKYGL